jgi:potassium/hydrogen antiporter
VNVIVRGDEAVPPRGSTRLRAGDIVHVLVRVDAAGQVRQLTDRWRSGPVGPPPRPEKPRFGRGPVFTAWRWSDADGDPARPGAVRGRHIVAQLRIRRDEPGGLWMLDDGRYAVTGSYAAVGGRKDVSDWALRRMRTASADEQAWLQTVIAAVAADRHETRGASRSP